MSRVVGLCVWLVGLLGCNTDGIVGGSCEFGLSACSHDCVNLALDEQNCGACGRKCGQREQCIAGSCIERLAESPSEPSPEVVPIKDAGPSRTPAPDEQGGAPSIPGAGGQSAGGEVTSGGAGGEPSPESGPCVPPLSGRQHCGACDAKCPEGVSFCAPDADLYRCVSDCEAPLLACDGRCVDAARETLHCGQCDRVCSSGLCRNGQCVREPSGHVVVMCMGFEQVFSSSPQTTLLGNAVFLSSSETAKILVFQHGSTDIVKRNAQKALNWASAALARETELVFASSAQSVADNLTVSNYDAFLMLDPKELAPEELAALGASFATAFEQFTRAGGTVIITHGAHTEGAPQFLGDDGAQLLSASGLVDVTFKELQNRAPAEPVGLDVATPFLALVSTCAYEATNNPGTDLKVIITGGNEESDDEAPVVVHRLVAP